MDDSIANFELTESTVQISNPSSAKSDSSEDIIIMDDTSSSSSSNALPETSQNFDNNLPETVTLLTHAETGAKVYLVGTAHFSQESKEDVAKVIQAVQPHFVILELCPARVSLLQMDEDKILEEAKRINMDIIIEKIKQNGAYYGLTYLLLLNLSARITKELGMAPGGEFREAFKEASKIPNCSVLLGDRPIKTTILRAMHKLTWFQLAKLIWQVLFSKDKISKEEIETCKKKDLLEQLLMEMSLEYPHVGEVFIEERDIYLTHTLQVAAQMTAKVNHPKPLKIVGVVGIGHTLGISKLWPVTQEKFIPNINVIPAPTLSSRIMRVTFKLTLLSLGGYLLYRFVPFPRILRDTRHSDFYKLTDAIKYR